MVTKGFQSGCNSSHQSLLKKKYGLPHLQIFFFLNKNFMKISTKIIYPKFLVTQKANWSISDYILCCNI